MRYLPQLSLSLVVKIISLVFKTLLFVNNWTVVSSYLKHNKEQSPMIMLRNGLKFYTNNNILDLTVIIETFGNESKYDYYIYDNSQQMNIIDVGANIGAFSIYAAKKYPQSKIFSFEPDKKNFDKLLKNISVNGICNIQCFNLAIGKTNGKILLYSVEGGDFGTVLSSTVRKGLKSTEVESRTLDKILEDNKIEYCDLLKMDCEGAEYDIIFNTKREIFDKIKLISIEFHQHDQYSGSDLKNFLKNINYDVSLNTNKRDKNFGFIYAKQMTS